MSQTKHICRPPVCELLNNVREKIDIYLPRETNVLCADS